MAFTAGAIQAKTKTYDLTNDWNGGPNPNGPWSFRQGIRVLPYQSTFAPLGNLALPGLGDGYAPNNAVGSFLPLVGQASANASSLSDFLAGDIVFHTVDRANGNPSFGPLNIDWTAPASGAITISGSIWYAQSSQARGNDFVLQIARGNRVIRTINSGSIAPNSGVGSSRNKQLRLSTGEAINVNAGDVVRLTVQPSAGQDAASAGGLRFVVTEVTND